MTKYTLEITAQNGREEMNTLLTNLATGESIEEMWYLEDDCWVWEDGWTGGDEQPGLFWTLNEDCERTDALLNELADSYYNKIEFEA